MALCIFVAPISVYSVLFCGPVALLTVNFDGKQVDYPPRISILASNGTNLREGVFDFSLPRVARIATNLFFFFYLATNDTNSCEGVGLFFASSFLATNGTNSHRLFLPRITLNLIYDAVEANTKQHIVFAFNLEDNPIVHRHAEFPQSFYSP